MGIVKTDLVAQFGSVYINEGQNMDRLKTLLRQIAVTPGYAVPIITENDTYKFSNVIFTELVQAFQKKFTPKGSAEFKPNKIDLFNIKIDSELWPDDVKGSYRGFLQNIKEQDRAQWPIVRWYLEEYLLKNRAHDMETKAYWGGSYLAPTDGVAGTTAGSMDGLKKKIDTGLAETDVTKKMQAVTLSAPITASNAFDAIEEFSDAIDDLLKTVPGTIYMSATILKWYLRDKRNTHGTDINYDAEKLTIDFSETVKLKSLPSMAGSPYIWYTVDENYGYLRKFNGMSEPEIQKDGRLVKFLCDWWEGLGFGYNPLVYVYKPA